MLLWLIFLFAFVGLTASDFFCPNLSTIASKLGMSESVVCSFVVLALNELDCELIANH